MPTFRVIELHYPTADYEQRWGFLPMIMDCSPGGSGSSTGVLVGLASRKEMDDLDYMICADFPRVLVDFSNGGCHELKWLQLNKIVSCILYFAG